MSIEAMKQALEALENKRHEYRAYQAITALRQAIEQAELAKPEQEPEVRWFQQFGDAPPRKEWVGLTDKEVLLTNGNEEYSIIAAPDSELIQFARAIGAKLKEKNNG